MIGEHPALDDLADTDRERVRLVAFAQDLAWWLNGAPTDDLGPLARVVTVVAARELRGTRALCRERPALAVEAAAKATETLWPHLREQAVRWSRPEEEVPADDAAGEEEGADGDVEGEEGRSPVSSLQSPVPEAEEEGSEDGGAGEEEGDGEDEDETENENDDSSPDDHDDTSHDDPAGDTPSPDGSPAPAGPSELETRNSQLETAPADPSARDPGAADSPLDLGAAAAAAAAAAADQAALDASRALSHMERFFPGAGWSLAPGAIQKVALSKLDRFVALVERLPELDTLAEQLGRLDEADRREGQELGGSEEVTGVHLGGEVAHALPSELGLLADPDTEDLFYSRWAERRLVSLELSGAGLDGSGDPDKRGPIIACLDASASMDGAPELASKALILALCRRVIPAGRVVHVLLFGGRGQHLEVRLDRRPSSLDALMDLLTRSFDGGTDFDGPLLRALDLLEEQALAKADVLVVTDGKAVVARMVEHRVQLARDALGLRVSTVVIGDGWVQSVRGFSDEVWSLAADRVEGALGLVRALSRP